MFRKMPIILLVLMALIGGLYPWIPLKIQAYLYGVSLSVKSLICFFLPLIIFGLLFKAAIGFARHASKTIFIILAAILVSNALSTMLSYLVGSLVYQFDLVLPFPKESKELVPMGAFFLPRWVNNDHAMFMALFLGVVLGRWRLPLATKISLWMDAIVSKMLKGLLYILPLFLTGFFIKMCHEGIIGSMLLDYGVIFGVITCFVFGYIFLLYFLASRRENISFIQSIKNMLPAAMVGFGSMSSAAALPLTIVGAEKNSQRPELSKSIIPTTVNIHLIGDCFAIPILAFAILKSFGLAAPGLLTYIPFALFFVLAKFSVAAVPGGGILVMLPILERYLGFDSTMLSLITALYILFDPVITTANILGNGAFATHLGKFLSKKTEIS